MMNVKVGIQYVAEWLPPNYQQNRVFLFLIVGFLVAMTGLGVRLRGPRLIAYGLVLILGLSYARGLAIFYLLTPIIFARPVAECAGWLAEQRKHVRFSQAPGAAASLDPVLAFLQRQSIMFPAIGLVGAIVVTAVFWRPMGFGPPDSVAPKAAVDFVEKAGITGNVFNSYNFGGYLIFRGIPTFVDGRQPPYTDKFLQEYYDTVKLRDSVNAFRLLDRYKVEWVLLLPEEPLAKSLAEKNQWNNVYSDKYAVVFVRSR
jgi:hypothetical protein